MYAVSPENAEWDADDACGRFEAYADLPNDGKTAGETLLLGNAEWEEEEEEEEEERSESDAESERVASTADWG